MLHSYSLERICHLTAGNSWMALACCMTRTPGVFICHTEAHAKALRRHVIQQLFRMKQSADDGVYDPGLMILLETFPKDVEATQTPIKPAKKASKGDGSTPPKKAKGDGSTPTPAKGTPAKPKGKKERRERRERRARRERRVQMMDLMKPRVMMNGHHQQRLRMQTDATGISAVVSFFVFVVWTHAIFVI